MRIRDLLLIRPFRNIKRGRTNPYHSETVSFQAFANEIPEKAKDSPAKVSFKSNSSVNEESGAQSKCPTLSTIAIIIILTAVFIVIPIIYVLNCFDVISKHSPSTFWDESSALEAPLVGKSHIVVKDNEFKVVKDLPFPPPPDYAFCRQLRPEERLDCYPEDGANRENCEARGCCWIPAKDKPISGVPLSTPYCFYPSNYQGYRYLNITQTAFGLEAFLKRNYRTAYPDDVEILRMIVKFEGKSQLHVKITDPLNNRFESPFPEVPIVDKAANNLLYRFDIDVNQPGFKVYRLSDNTVLFDVMDFSNFIFSNQFLQITTKLPSKYIYGIGEHRSNLLLSTNWSRFTLFNHDAIPSFNKNLYGSHPFYLVMEESGNSHGVFLLNSNAMDVILQPMPAITFRPIGGVLDFYIFLGPTPAQVVSQYNDLIGKPFLPPYWALGFHLCRFGYKTLNDTIKVMQRNIDAGIPLDTQWNDLDYMDNSNDFTYDKTRFRDLPQFVQKIHSMGMHYIPLIDAGVSASEKKGTYPPYDIGIQMGIFVKNSTDQPFIGKVWNKGTTVWPDFTHPNTVDYWTDMLRDLHKKFEFDGAWIDMNEPSNFLSGQFNGCPKSSLDSPPYFPAIDGGVINYKTMCMTAKHYAGLHYDVHNLFGLTEAMITSFAMAEIRGKRPMVISRSTFAGHGHYAGHWSGDVVSDWLDMKYSVPQLLSFSLFGVPLMGADICGFNGNVSASLCNRWMQLGAFYPFSRNHNTDDGIDQDPAAMGPQVIQSSKKALNIRYSFLPYLYSLFYKSHIFAETVSRPLFIEYPNDQNTYAIDTQFLWGPALMIVPVLADNQQSVSAYLPKALWYDFYTKIPIFSQGQTVNLSAPLDTIPILIRGGYIFPRQDPKSTTTATRKGKIELLATCNENGSASGDLYWDDGDSLNTFEEKRYTYLKFNLSENTLRIQYDLWAGETPPNLGRVLVLGITKSVTQVTVNNLSQAFKFDTIHKYLTIDNLDLSFKSPIVINWK